MNSIKRVRKIDIMKSEITVKESKVEEMKRTGGEEACARMNNIRKRSQKQIK